jgi:hypothetical protein
MAKTVRPPRITWGNAGSCVLASQIAPGMVYTYIKSSHADEIISFSVGVNIDGATVTCRLYEKMGSKNPSRKSQWITYTKVPSKSLWFNSLFSSFNIVTGGTGDSDKCPPIPDGYYPISEAQIDQAAKAGEAMAEKYSEQEALARRSYNLTARALPDSYDQRTKIKLVRKNQSGSGLCGMSRHFDRNLR